MNKLTEFLKAIDYNITDAGEYGWGCYGDDIRSIDSYVENKTECSAIFTKNGGSIREITLHDYQARRSYRWSDPDFEAARKAEALAIDTDDNNAYDELSFIELEVIEDILEKVYAVSRGLPYDTRVMVPVDLSKDEFYEVAMAAHSMDITINEFFEKALKEALCLA